MHLGAEVVLFYLQIYKFDFYYNYFPFQSMFDSQSRDNRGLSVADKSSVLLKFADILHWGNYIQDAHLEYQDSERQYFQLQFVKIKVADVLINRNILFVPRQRNVSNNGTNPK